MLTEQEVKAEFKPGGALDRWDWNVYGRNMVGLEIEWLLDENGKVEGIILPPSLKSLIQNNMEFSKALENRLILFAKVLKHRMAEREFRRLFADRDIRAETQQHDLKDLGNGTGATAMIERYLNMNGRDRELIRRDLLNSLNEIFSPDARFAEIIVRRAEGGGVWEVFLNAFKCSGEFARDVLHAEFDEF